MIACILIPGFELRAVLRERPRLATRAAALAPLPGTDPLVGCVTSAAEAAGVRPGMRLGEALAMCPSLELVEQDPAEAGQAWEGVVRRLEDEGFAVESAGVGPTEYGCLYFETKGVERLYGGVAGVLERALAALGSSWDARAGAAERKFAALAAASVARAGQGLVVEGERTEDFLAPLPLSLLPLDETRYAELEGLGMKTVGQLASLPGSAVAERLGPDGRRAWSLARGGDRRRVRPRRPPAEIAERLEFGEAVGNELTLRRALGTLVERTLGRKERADRAVRKLALSARLVGGGSWRRSLTLREPTAEKERLRVALGPKLAELPAPVTAIGLEVVELAEWTGQQLELVRPEGSRVRSRLKEGLRQARASAGSGAVCTIVEVAPWSRIPERRALLVPRD
jgi:nucleotidyltransferase/DNA polymerase involved in DNA repair